MHYIPLILDKRALCRCTFLIVVVLFCVGLFSPDGIAGTPMSDSAGGNKFLQTQPPAPDGFSWQFYKSAAFIKPIGWKERQQSIVIDGIPVGIYSASPGEMGGVEPFDMGMTVEVINGLKNVTTYQAEEMTVRLYIMPVIETLKAEDILVIPDLRKEGYGKKFLFRYREKAKNGKDLIINRYVVGDNASDTVYAFTFKSPVATWDENSEKYVKPIFKGRLGLTNDPVVEGGYQSVDVSNRAEIPIINHVDVWVKKVEKASIDSAPSLPEGFSWRVYQDVILPKPIGWYEKEKLDTADGLIKRVYAISPEAFGDAKQFEMGFTIQITNGISQIKTDAAISKSGLYNVDPLAAMVLGPIITTRKKEEILMLDQKINGELNTSYIRYRDMSAGSKPIIVYKSISVNRDQDKLYIFTFESPEKSWDSNWKKYGEPIVKMQGFSSLTREK